MASVPPEAEARPASGHLGWAYRIDLEHTPRERQRVAIGSLVRLRPGDTVDLIVGDLDIVDAAHYIEHDLGEVIAAGVDVRLVGSPAVLAEWWHAIRAQAERQRPRQPALRVVR